jgi:hypothetical protein
MSDPSYARKSLGETLAAGSHEDRVRWQQETADPDRAGPATIWFGASQHVRLTLRAIGDQNAPDAIQLTLDCGSYGVVTFSSDAKIAEGIFDFSLRLHWHEVLAAIDTDSHNEANEGIDARPFRARLESAVLDAVPAESGEVQPIALMREHPEPDIKTFSKASLMDALIIATRGELIGWELGGDRGEDVGPRDYLRCQYHGICGPFGISIYYLGELHSPTAVAVGLDGPDDQNALFTSRRLEVPSIVVPGLENRYAELTEAILPHRDARDDFRANAFKDRLAEILAEAVADQEGRRSRYDGDDLITAITRGAANFRWGMVEQTVEAGLFCLFAGDFGIYQAGVYVQGDDHDHPETVALSLNDGTDLLVVASRSLDGLQCSIDRGLLTNYPALIEAIKAVEPGTVSDQVVAPALSTTLAQLLNESRSTSEDRGDH